MPQPARRRLSTIEKLAEICWLLTANQVTNERLLTNQFTNELVMGELR